MTSDTPKESDSDTVGPKDVHQRLEDDVDLLNRVTEDLESLLQNSGEEKSTPLGKGTGGSNTDPITSDLDIADILGEPGVTKMVINDLDTAIELLEQDQHGIEGELRLLLTASITELLSEKFPLNSYFQKLDETEDLQIRQDVQDERELPGIVIKEEEIYYPLSFGTLDTYLEISTDQVFKTLNDQFTSLFEAAGEMDLDIPPWRELLNGLAGNTSSETADEFETLVEAATPDDLESLDEVSLALIAGARTGALQYDISHWGENMNIASKATFSRRKSALVDDGVITTEPVHVEVGRPRDRLLINEESPETNGKSSRTTTDSGRDESERSRESSQNQPNREDNTEGENLDDILDDMLRDVLLSE